MKLLNDNEIQPLSAEKRRQELERARHNRVMRENSSSIHPSTLNAPDDEDVTDDMDGICTSFEPDRNHCPTPPRIAYRRISPHKGERLNMDSHLSEEESSTEPTTKVEEPIAAIEATTDSSAQSPMMSYNIPPEGNVYHIRLRTGKRFKIFSVIILLTLICGGIAWALIAYCSSATPEYATTEPIDESPKISVHPPGTPEELLDILPYGIPRFVNALDMPIAIINLGMNKASLSTQRADSADRHITFQTTAADVRADNGMPVNDFIINGKRLASGMTKDAFCYISPDGNIILGTGKAEKYQQEAIDNNGSFFRQYPLVMNGTVMKVPLTNQAKRRALAVLNGHPVIILSLERENVNDFAHALASIGITDAIYLPGGEGLLHCVTSDDIQHVEKFDKISPHENYITFKTDK